MYIYIYIYTCISRRPKTRTPFNPTLLCRAECRPSSTLPLPDRWRKFLLGNTLSPGKRSSVENSPLESVPGGQKKTSAWPYTCARMPVYMRAGRPVFPRRAKEPVLRAQAREGGAGRQGWEEAYPFSHG